MGLRCFLCDYQPSKLPKGTGYRTMHSLPSIEPVRTKWLSFCDLVDQADEHPNFRLCSNHFTVDDYKDYANRSILGRRMRLKEDAVPSILTMLPDSCSAKADIETNINVIVENMENRDKESNQAHKSFTSNNPVERLDTPKHVTVECNNQRLKIIEFCPVVGQTPLISKCVTPGKQYKPKVTVENIENCHKESNQANKSFSSNNPEERFDDRMHVTEECDNQRLTIIEFRPVVGQRPLISKCVTPGKQYKPKVEKMENLEISSNQAVKIMTNRHPKNKPMHVTEKCSNQRSEIIEFNHVVGQASLKRKYVSPEDPCKSNVEDMKNCDKPSNQTDKSCNSNKLEKRFDNPIYVTGECSKQILKTNQLSPVTNPTRYISIRVPPENHYKSNDNVNTQLRSYISNFKPNMKVENMQNCGKSSNQTDETFTNHNPEERLDNPMHVTRECSNQKLKIIQCSPVTGQTPLIGTCVSPRKQYKSKVKKMENRGNSSNQAIKILAVHNPKEKPVHVTGECSNWRPVNVQFIVNQTPPLDKCVPSEKQPNNNIDRKRAHKSTLRMNCGGDVKSRKLNQTILTLHEKNQQCKKRMREQIRYLKRRLKSRNELVKQLKQQTLLNEKGSELLNSLPAAIREMIDRQSGKQSSYSPSMRTFACTLHSYSPRAYQYVRKVWNNLLPSCSALKKWHKIKDV